MSSTSSSGPYSQPLSIPGRRRALSVGTSLGRQSFSHITCTSPTSPKSMGSFTEKSRSFSGSGSPPNSPPNAGFTSYFQILSNKSNQLPETPPQGNKLLPPHARVQALKNPKNIPDRPASPMRSMILNGQFLD
ncbi:hypothetical protein K493DRAFT_299905 [Basidiobolus meristosporus CBS 931.73]|uniref:Uncharacterized protein n=1 Tax=Basidiobolus meristosporus CBS 931.73 TaxID=1314790 RepID=A0A1Y1YKW5_9FUNG|nr:hypothetical protein K493DRAFT_299905 [Basidiobolus meristosporus CBS 931.73]|eukprot:ORX98473.1 hypothetical protein K493DRAFT_299905 [Basidiobolus meristosporus CBS 931.73]